MVAVEDVVLPERLDLCAGERLDALTRRKWTADDLAGLCADWPDADELFDLPFLVEQAISFAQASAGPDQARAWLRVLYIKGRTDVDPSPAALTWAATHPDRRVNHIDPGADIVWFYGDAAGYDHDLARLAFLAGLSEEELRVRRKAGTLDRSGLHASADQLAGH